MNDKDPNADSGYTLGDAMAAQERPRTMARRLFGMYVLLCVVVGTFVMTNWVWDNSLTPIFDWLFG